MKNLTPIPTVTTDRFRTKYNIPTYDTSPTHLPDIAAATEISHNPSARCDIYGNYIDTIPPSFIGGPQAIATVTTFPQILTQTPTRTSRLKHQQTPRITLFARSFQRTLARLSHYLDDSGNIHSIWRGSPDRLIAVSCVRIRVPAFLFILSNYGVGLRFPPLDLDPLHHVKVKRTCPHLGCVHPLCHTPYPSTIKYLIDFQIIHEDMRNQLEEAAADPAKLPEPIEPLSGTVNPLLAVYDELSLMRTPKQLHKGETIRALLSNRLFPTVVQPTFDTMRTKGMIVALPAEGPDTYALGPRDGFPQSDFNPDGNPKPTLF